MDLTDGRSEVLTLYMSLRVSVLHQTVEEHRLSPEVIRLADQLVQGLI